MKECVKEILNNKKVCGECKCRYWFKRDKDLNCSLVSVEYDGEHNMVQIADKLSLSLSTVYKIHNKALSKLKKRGFLSEF